MDDHLDLSRPVDKRAVDLAFRRVREATNASLVAGRSTIVETTLTHVTSDGVDVDLLFLNALQSLALETESRFAVVRLQADSQCLKERATSTGRLSWSIVRRIAAAYDREPLSGIGPALTVEEARAFIEERLRACQESG